MSNLDLNKGESLLRFYLNNIDVEKDTVFDVLSIYRIEEYFTYLCVSLSVTELGGNDSFIV